MSDELNEKMVRVLGENKAFRAALEAIVKNDEPPGPDAPAEAWIPSEWQGGVHDMADIARAALREKGSDG